MPLYQTHGLACSPSFPSKTFVTFVDRSLGIDDRTGPNARPVDLPRELLERGARSFEVGFVLHQPLRRQVVPEMFTRHDWSVHAGHDMHDVAQKKCRRSRIHCIHNFALECGNTIAKHRATRRSVVHVERCKLVDVPAALKSEMPDQIPLIATQQAVEGAMQQARPMPENDR